MGIWVSIFKISINSIFYRFILLVLFKKREEPKKGKEIQLELKFFARPDKLDSRY